MRRRGTAVALALVLASGLLVPTASTASAASAASAASSVTAGAATTTTAPRTPPSTTPTPATSSRTVWRGASSSGNRPPSVPDDVRFTDPVAPCVTGPGRPFLRSATPTVAAVHSDRDGQQVRAVVTVSELRPSGDAVRVFSARSVPQASGVQQSVTLRGMRHARVYRVRVVSEDTRGRRGPGVSCEVVVDLVAPRVAPSVTAVAVGSQPVYAEGVPAGGVGQPGSFLLGDGGVRDVVGYQYSLGSSDATQTAAGRAPTITVTPTASGTQRLYVRSVDRAGWVGPATSYDLLVASAGRVTWELDETAGPTAASTAPDGSDPAPMTISPSMETRVGGLLADVAGITTDRALLFDAPGDLARTSGPVADTTQSFSVSAAVKPASGVGTATAASQDGTTTAGFRLGYQPCASGVGTCWSFSVPSADDPSADRTTVLSTIAVDTGGWSEVTGVHDAAAGTLRLYVCRSVPGSFGTRTWTVTDAGSAAAPAPWAATGPFRLGSATGPDPAPWAGAVGRARVTAGVVTDGDLRRSCPPPA